MTSVRNEMTNMTCLTAKEYCNTTCAFSEVKKEQSHPDVEDLQTLNAV